MSRVLGRECGSCTLCCRVMAVNADDGTELTPLDTWCQHCQVGRGCQVYAQRPRGCRTFTCGWLGGLFGQDDRPDRSKIIATLTPMEVDTDAGPVRMPVLEFHECAPGALETSRARRMIRQAHAGAFPLALSPFDRSPSEIQFRTEQQRRLLDPAVAAELVATLEGVAATLD